jgi:rhamnosyltransferase
MRYEVCTVVVTYNPYVPLFKEVIARLNEQTAKIIVVDNHSKNSSEIAAMAAELSAKFVAMPQNMGIACAQNVGATYGIKQHAQYILFMDQDTILPDGAVDDLCQACRELEAEGVKVGSIGHAYRDTHDNKIKPSIKAQGHRLIKQDVSSASATLIATDFVIASGSLIPTPSLQEVGLMDETLFIDLVDIEWGLRALSSGHKNFQSTKKIMTHTLGHGRVSFFGKSVPLHPPIRDYYVIRNSISMVHRKYVGLAWKLYFFGRIIPFFIVFGFFADQKRKRLYFMTRGLLDGLLKRGGKYMPYFP